VLRIMSLVTFLTGIHAIGVKSSQSICHFTLVGANREETVLKNLEFVRY
jgi:hypothetical protein